MQAFSFPLPETRFIKAGSFIYKFKIRGGGSYRLSSSKRCKMFFNLEKQSGETAELQARDGEEVMRGNCSSRELQEIIRTVLGNLDNLQPFSSAHFTVFPYKKRCDGLSKVICEHCERNLKAYPFVLTLYLERNVHNGKRAEEKSSPEKEVAQQSPSVCEPQSKRCRRDSPLEEAILKDLIEDLEAERKVSVVGRLHVNRPRAGGEVKGDPGHVDEKEAEGFDEPSQKSGVSTFRGSGTPGEVHSGTTQDMGEEEGDEEGENADSARGTPVKPGILTRLASHIFPLSLLFRDP